MKTVLIHGFTRTQRNRVARLLLAAGLSPVDVNIFATDVLNSRFTVKLHSGSTDVSAILTCMTLRGALYSPRHFLQTLEEMFGNQAP